MIKEFADGEGHAWEKRLGFILLYNTLPLEVDSMLAQGQAELVHGHAISPTHSTISPRICANRGRQAGAGTRRPMRTTDVPNFFGQTVQRNCGGIATFSGGSGRSVMITKLLSSTTIKKKCCDKKQEGTMKPSIKVAWLCAISLVAGLFLGRALCRFAVLYSTSLRSS